VADLTPRATGQNSKFEAKLLKKYPPIFTPTRYEMHPCIVQDKDGNILLWYLPGAITMRRAVSFFFHILAVGFRGLPMAQSQTWEDLKILERSLRIKACKSWRVSPTYFRAKSGWLKPGSISMAPAWFQQAHEVTHPIYCQSKMSNSFVQESNHMEVSAELMKSHTLNWVETQMRASALIGGILSIVHPDLYSIGIACLKEMEASESISKGDRLPEVLRIWSSPFTAITTISNRDTPYHRDNGSAHPWFDILMALGTYQNGRIEFPGLGMRFKYDPGTAVALAGRVLQHGAICPGDRACIAYHMKENVVEELGIAKVSWANKQGYSS
jgi:Oxygenase domain of the 2OGFeDO superfamily